MGTPQTVQELSDALVQVWERRVDKTQTQMRIMRETITNAQKPHTKKEKLQNDKQEKLSFLLQGWAAAVFIK